MCCEVVPAKQPNRQSAVIQGIEQQEKTPTTTTTLQAEAVTPKQVKCFPCILYETPVAHRFCGYKSS